MLPAAIVATSLAVVPMVERCRSALMQFSFVPEAESDVRLQVSEEGWIAVGSPVGLIPADIPPIDDVSVALLRSELPDVGAEPAALSCGSEIVCAQPLRLDGLSSPHGAMDADFQVTFEGIGIVPEGVGPTVGLMPCQTADAAAADIMPTVGRPPDAELQLAFSYVASPIRETVPCLPPVVIPEPRALPSNVVAATTALMVYNALVDGSANARAREWRMPLVRMLVTEPTGTDFDRVYGLLLRGFGGNDERARILALAKWADANLPPRDAAEVCRAETRHWLNLGDAAMTADAAGRMERARPDYAVRARRLTALAYAMSGELEKAKSEIARSRAECPLTGVERHEILYLEAWVALQEGDVALARRNLTAIVAESPDGATVRKARRILESISEEAHE